MANRIAPFEVAFDWLDKRIEAILEKKDSGGYESLTDNEKMIYLVMSYDASVRNGGIVSFLDGPAGDKFSDLVSFLKQLGAAAVALDLEEVIQILQAVNATDPLAVLADRKALKALPIAEKFKETEERNTQRYDEYEPGPIQLLYRHLKAAK